MITPIFTNAHPTLTPCMVRVPNARCYAQAVANPACYQPQVTVTVKPSMGWCFCTTSRADCSWSGHRYSFAGYEIHSCAAVSPSPPPPDPPSPPLPPSPPPYVAECASHWSTRQCSQSNSLGNLAAQDPLECFRLAKGDSGCHDLLSRIYIRRSAPYTCYFPDDERLLEHKLPCRL